MIPDGHALMFTFGKLLTILLLPTAAMATCAMVGLLLSRWRIGRILLTLGVASLGICLVLPVDSWLLQPLEDRFPPVADLPARVDGIVLLGGAIDEITSKDRGTPTLTWAANRITSFVILARRYPDARLVFTGGSGAIDQGVATEAEYARTLFGELGLPPGRVMYEDKSRTTWENAVFAKALAQPQPGERWVLLTSASHMPRSVGAFRAAGWTVLPWPVGYETRDHISAWPASFGYRLGLLDWAVHEWLGLAAYRLRGWTPRLFPGPDAAGTNV